MIETTEDGASLISLARGVPGPTPAILHEGGGVTYAELQGRASDLAGAIRAVLAPDSAVCMSSPSGPDFVVCLLALAMARARVSLAHHALSVPELDSIASDARAAGVISGRPQWDGPTRPSRSLRLRADTWLHLLPCARDAVGGGTANMALHMYSSGTDGRVKGVIRNRDSLMAEARGIASNLGYSPGTRVLCATPLCHAYGFGMGLSSVLAAGATLVIAHPRTPNHLRACIARYRPHVLIGVPVQYDLWSQGERRGVEPGLLRLCISSGAPLSAGVARSFFETWGRSPARQYGMSECGAVSIDFDAQPESPSVGKPYPGVAVRVDASCPEQDGDGEIIVNGPYLASGYVGGLEDELPRNPFSKRGFLTGDLGRIDPEGRLIMTGRRSRQINVHGNKVDPAQVEAVIAACRGVRDVAVLGIGTASQDQWVAAFVVADPAIGADDILGLCKMELAPFKRPQRIIHVDAIPRNAMGKVDYRALLARLGK